MADPPYRCDASEMDVDCDLVKGHDGLHLCQNFEWRCVTDDERAARGPFGTDIPGPVFDDDICDGCGQAITVGDSWVSTFDYGADWTKAARYHARCEPRGTPAVSDLPDPPIPSL